MAEAQLFLHCDPATFLRNVEYDRVLQAELAELFVDSAAGHRLAIESAATSGDALRLRSHVHTLKGSLGIFGADAGLAVVRRIERFIADAPRAIPHALVASLVVELEGLCRELLHCLPDGTAPAASDRTPAAR
jgi:HPt (histidine-containing phosphotransfer) domain-containing protein